MENTLGNLHFVNGKESMPNDFVLFFDLDDFVLFFVQANLNLTEEKTTKNCLFATNRTKLHCCSLKGLSVVQLLEGNRQYFNNDVVM